MLGPPTMVNERDAGAEVAEALSVTWTEKVKVPVPLAVGVPLITPAELSEMPGGNGPLPLASDHVKVGPVPPDSDRVVEYATVASPCGTDVVVTTGGGGGGGLICRVYVTLALPPTESVTVAVKFGKLPVWVGVPLMEPPLKVKPFGSVPVNATPEYGGVPFAAEIVTEYGAPCCPTGNDAGLRLKAALIVIVMDSGADGPKASVACTSKVELPLDEGVPVRFTLLPLVESNEIPAGGEPEPETNAHVHKAQGSGPSVAVRFREYEVPTSPTVGPLCETTGCAAAAPANASPSASTPAKPTLPLDNMTAS